MARHAVEIGSLLRFLGAGSMLLLSQESIAQNAPPTAPLWRYVAPAKINRFTQTALGTLMVSSDSGAAMLDPETGREKWSHPEFAGVRPIFGTTYGIGRTPDGTVVVDLETGSVKWDFQRLNFVAQPGYWTLPSLGLVLAYGRTSESALTVVAAELETGNVRWRQDSLFATVADFPANIEKFRLVKGQPVLYNTDDSSMILYPSHGGPIRLDRTGRLLWRADTLSRRDLPESSRGYPTLLAVGGAVFVPYERRLIAIELADGRVRWDRSENFRTPVRQLAMTPHGLLVRGESRADRAGPIKPFLDLLDPETGASRWPKAFRDMKNSSPFLVRGATAYLGTERKLLAVSLPDGVTRELTEVKFEGGEDPAAMEWWEDDLLVSANQNLARVDTAGAIKYQKYFKAPGASLLAKIITTALIVGLNTASYAVTPAGGMYRVITSNPVLSARYSATERARRYLYVYTSRADTAGQVGFSLVRIRKDDGEEEGRAWVNQRRPDYELDAIAGIVFVKRGDREIEAVRF